MSDEALLYGTGLSDKPKYTPIEYQKMTTHIDDQIRNGNGKSCLEDAEQFEKAVWAYGILKLNAKLDGNEKGMEAKTTKRKSPEPKEEKFMSSSTKTKKKRTR